MQNRKNRITLETLIGLDFTEVERKIITEVLSKYKGDKKSKVIRYIYNLKVYDTIDENLECRIGEILSLGKDSSSLHSHIIRYGEKYGKIFFEEKGKSCSITTNRMIEKYGEEEAKRRFRNRGASLEIYIERLGEKEGKERWQKYLDNRAKAYRKKRESGHIYPKYTEEYYINLHGKDKGSLVWRAKIEKQRYKVSRQRYIDEFGYEDGKEVCRKIKDNLSFDSVLERFNGDENLAKSWLVDFKDRKALSTSKAYFSKSSFDFFSELCELYDLNGALYADKEKILHLNEAERLIIPQRIVAIDFLCGYAAIEYHGDLYHANPFFFESSDIIPRVGIPAHEKWGLDLKKKKIIEQRGYKLITIWEHEVMKDKEYVLKTCYEHILMNKESNNDF